MSEQNPYEQLGVTEESSFEEIQEAKQRLVQQYQNDSKIVELIESAYDSVLMDRLRMRQEGRIKVPDRIRFPERLAIPVESKPVTSSKSPNWWQSLIDTPSAEDIGVPAVIYACLGAITLLVPDPSGSLLPLLLAFGVFVNIYFFNSGGVSQIRKIKKSHKIYYFKKNQNIIHLHRFVCFRGHFYTLVKQVHLIDK